MALSQDKTSLQPGLLREDRRGRLDILPQHPLVLSPAIAVDVPRSCSCHRRIRVQSPATLPGRPGTRPKKSSRRIHRRAAKSLRPAHRRVPPRARILHRPMRTGCAPARRRGSSPPLEPPAVDLPGSAGMEMERARQQHNQTVCRQETIHPALGTRPLLHSACTPSLDRRKSVWLKRSTAQAGPDHS